MTWLNCIAVWRAGGRPVVYKPGSLASLEDIDGVVIGGGDDLNPALYGGDLAYDVRVDPARDQLEYRVLQHANENGLPVLGICRGSQLLNVFFGGNLHGDIYEIYEDAPRLRTPLPRKRVQTIKGTQINRLVDCDECNVNSLHHQSVNRLGDGFEVAAKDDEGIIQGIEKSDADFMLGVQWHPEMLPFDKGQQNLFRGLVRCASQRASTA